MPLVGRNIVANLIGGILLTAMMLALAPLQIRLLGMEAFGIIGFITALQVVFAAFDMGLSSTLTRELAADHSSNKEASLPLIRTALTVYWSCAILIGIGLALGAEMLARDWFNAGSIPIPELVQSLQVIALYVALRWPVAVYTGILTGVQRMEALNVIKVVVLSLRMAGGIAVLLIWPSLPAFLWWTAFSAIMEIAAYHVACQRLFPSMPSWPGFSLPAIRRVWRFSASMNLIAVIAVLIVQCDRLLISKLLPLEALGAYNLAYTAASAITLLVTAVSTAVLPSFAATHSRQELDHLHRNREQADRILLFLVTPAAGALIFHGETILALWIGPAAAASAAGPMLLLAAGFWISAAIANVYNAAVASGNPGTHLRANLIAVVPYLAVLYLLILRFGITGAAAAWLLLNVGYAVLLVPIVQRRVLGISTLRWLSGVVMPFVILGCLSFMLPLLVADAAGLPRTRVVSLITLCASALLWALASYPLGLWQHGKTFLELALARVRH